MPRLYPAYLLDAELVKISKEFEKGPVAWCPSAPYLNNEEDLSMVIAEMTRRAQLLNLHEFFLCDFNRNSFLGSLPGLSSATVMAKIKSFNKDNLFNQDPAQVL